MESLVLIVGLREDAEVSLRFARTGLKIEEMVWSLMRSGLVDVEGRGAAACYRNSRQ